MDEKQIASRVAKERVGHTSPGLIFNKAVLKCLPGDRIIYGTRSEKWHVIDSEDRDYDRALTPQEASRLGELKSYLKIFGR